MSRQQFTRIACLIALGTVQMFQESRSSSSGHSGCLVPLSCAMWRWRSKQFEAWFGCLCRITATTPWTFSEEGTTINVELEVLHLQNQRALNYRPLALCTNCAETLVIVSLSRWVKLFMIDCSVVACESFATFAPDSGFSTATLSDVLGWLIPATEAPSCSFSPS